MATIDGSIQLVKVVTDADLRQNGGSFVIAGRMAQPIQGFDTLTKRASGGNAIPVYVVSDAQIANGTFRLKGGSALPMADIDVVAAGVKTIQGAAVPVYVVSGSLAGGGAAVEYLLRDEFTTDETAPLTSPRTAEPGPGTLTLVQTDGQFSVVGSELVFPAQATAVYGDQYLVGDAIIRAGGRSLLLAINFNAVSPAAEAALGWWKTNSAINPGIAGHIEHFLWFYRSGALYARSSPAGSSQETYAATTAYQIAMILRGTGCFFFLKGGAFAEWTLIWVSSANNTATLYPGFSNYLHSGVLDDFRVTDLAAPYDTDYGLATNRTESPGDGATSTSEANASIEVTITAATGVTQELDVRRTDDDNRWIVRMSQAGSTIKLIQREGGVETERASAAQTWTNGTAYRVVAIQDGNTIRTYVANVAKNTYASATFNNTATGVKISHAASNLVAWPRVLSGTALAVLEAV